MDLDCCERLAHDDHEHYIKFLGAFPSSIFTCSVLQLAREGAMTVQSVSTKWPDSLAAAASFQPIAAWSLGSLGPGPSGSMPRSGWAPKVKS